MGPGHVVRGRMSSHVVMGTICEDVSPSGDYRVRPLNQTMVENADEALVDGLTVAAIIRHPHPVAIERKQDEGVDVEYGQT